MGETFLGYLSYEKDISLIDQKGVLYAEKKIPYDQNEDRGEPNFYFHRQIRLMNETKDTNLPFVPIVSSLEPSKREDGFIRFKYLEGGNLKHQIDINSTTTTTRNYTFDQYAPIDFPDEEKEPISYASSRSFKIIDFNLDIPKKMRIIYGISAAVKFLHDKKILHRGIMPENVLLDQDCRPYLFDFDLARNVTGTQQMSGVKGLKPYMAPEMFQKLGSLASDIFSLGATILYILNGKITMKVQTENRTISPNCHFLTALKLYQLMEKGSKYDIPNNIPDSLASLIDRCLNFDYDQRPTAKEILDILENDEISKFGGQEYVAYYKSLRINLPKDIDQ